MPVVRTDQLEIALRVAGPRDGLVVLLIHGWPDDATSWEMVEPALNDAAKLHDGIDEDDRAAAVRTVAQTHVADGL